MNGVPTENTKETRCLRWKRKGVIMGINIPTQKDWFNASKQLEKEWRSGKHNISCCGFCHLVSKNCPECIYEPLGYTGCTDPKIPDSFKVDEHQSIKRANFHRDILQPAIQAMDENDPFFTEERE